MNKTIFQKKPEPIVWKQFTRHSDAVFLSLGREIRIGVLSVATLAASCPGNATAAVSMGVQQSAGMVVAADVGPEDELLDVSELLHGDLLFTVTSPDRDGVAKAIASVTEGYDLLQVSHVAIVCQEADGQVYALEASSEHGVWLNPIQAFLDGCDHTSEGRPLVVVGRMKDRSNVGESVERAKTYLGHPYDNKYMPGDTELYCSELVHYAYLDNDGNALFPQEPMSFHDKSGKVTQFWRDYYREKNMEVPEGLPGTNPGGISRSSKIAIIGKLY